MVISVNLNKNSPERRSVGVISLINKKGQGDWHDGPHIPLPNLFYCYFTSAGNDFTKLTPLEAVSLTTANNEIEKGDVIKHGEMDWN